MTVIELSDEQAEALTALAEAEGLSLAAWLQRLAAPALVAPHHKPFETSQGALAHLGPAPSLEEFKQNRSEMFGRFADDI